MDGKSNPNIRDLQEEGESEHITYSYRLLSSEEIYHQIYEWKETYSDFLRVTTSQEKYGLPAAGTDRDCPFVEGKGCPNWILEIQDYAIHTDGSSSSNNLPAVFWSGCLHGNERVGPTATIEAVGLLLKAARCEATTDRKCRRDLQDQYGMTNAHRKWLARLVTTRKLTVVPTSNALGYYRNIREEGLVDPNRDFPYDLQDPTKCMQTIAGRTLNELYRDNLFQLALTFHAGMEVVGYEWGAPTWLHHYSPDDVAQESIASAYSRYGGGWSKSKPYQYGTMNDMVYYVRGGMEDWAYAASWDSERVVQCQPKTFGGYPAEKTRYNNSTLRVFNMLVETSDQKTPATSNLGASRDVLLGDTQENGHVSRNIRLALLAAELVEPYISVVGVNEVVLQDDLPPMQSRSGQSCQKTQAFLIAKDAEEVEIQFSVGGAMTVNDVELWYAQWKDIPNEQLDCLSQPRSLEVFQKGEILGATNGTGYFSDTGSHPRPPSSSDLGSATLGPIFRGKISIPKGLNTLDALVVLASARVDQDWANRRSNTKPNLAPQSHVVNARTSPDWHHESAGQHIHGRLDWFSSPLTIEIGDFEEGVGTHNGQVVTTVELNPRHSGGANKSGLKPKSASDDQLWFPVSMWYAFAILLGVLAFCLCCVTLRQRSNRHDRFKKAAMAGGYSEDDGFTFDPKPYSDTSLDDDDDLDDDDLNDGVELPSLS